MPEYLSPGVYVEEVSGGIKPIEGVGTSTGAFIGVAEKGPIAGAQYEDGVGRPVLITNFTEFTRNFGGFVQGEFLAYAVRQFFGEGGTRCFVARTAHFNNPANRASLTARRSTVILPGINTTIALGLPTANATSAVVGNRADIATGMILVISNGTVAARVLVVDPPAGPPPAANTIFFVNTVVDAVMNPVPLPVIATSATAPVTVRQVVLDVFALNEGEWGDSLRVNVTPTGLTSTTLNMPANPAATPPVIAGLSAGATTAVVNDLTGIAVGSTLLIFDGANALRVQVVRVDPGKKEITFAILNFTPQAPPGTTPLPPPPVIGNGATVLGLIPGKVSTVLTADAVTGSASVNLQSVEGIEVGSILLFVAQNMGTLVAPAVVPGVTNNRRTVTRVVGKQIFLNAPLSADFLKDITTVTTENFTLQVYNGDDLAETFANLSMENTNATDYVENQINLSGQRSKYIRVREAPIIANNLPPARTAAPVRLTGGDKGADDAEGDYIGDPAAQTGFFAFDSIDDVNIMAAPGVTFRPVILAGMTYCENRKDCFYVAEVPKATQTVNEVLDFKNGSGPFAGKQALNSKYGAIYWPWVKGLDPLTNLEISLPPSGAAIGSYSATDVRRGVHKAPAGMEDGFLNTVTGVEKVVTMGEHDLLNPKGVNVIRSLPDIGIVIWGARTTSSDPEWKYVNVRRLFLFLEESIDQGTQWVVFEPNDKTLWKRIIRNISAFLTTQWREGALVGDKPEKAFFVKCDEETNPPESVDLGRVVTIIGVAPSKPAEFVIFRIMQARPGEA